MKNLIRKILKESDWDWLENTREHANYNGHPQGIVKLYNHDEIDRLCDIIDNYNGFSNTITRGHLHQGLEFRRDELELMSAEDGEDYGEAMLSVTFFVERKNGPNSLTLGYWPYDVDEWSINDWFGYGYTYNKDYEMYDSIEQVENLFKNYKNPNLMKESDELDWIRDANPIPEGIKKILTLPAGDYKIWLGDISKEQQLNILDYLQNSISDSEEHTTNGNINVIRWRVDNNRLNINSLYFDVYKREHRQEWGGDKIKIIVSMMGVYEDEDEGPKDQQYKYCRNYFDESGDIEI